MNGAARVRFPHVVGRIAAAATLVTALMVWQAWGRWAIVAGVVAIHLAHVAVVRLLHPWWERHPPGGHADVLMTAMHDSLNVLASHIAQWSAASWLLVPMSVFSASAHQDRESWRHLVLLLAANVTVASLDGVPASTIAVNCALCVALYTLWDGRTLLLRGTLAQLRAERAKLQEAQRQLVEQEKMSSLGMLAAGVAHEINNPMSYVGCNLRELAHDLPRLAHDAELLRAYRDDVLPATLDGVERVNAIVADLRRFARGDAEHAQPFDLNAEVSAALRIAQNELRGRATTEVSLGELPPISGRPQEIARVVVNLLVNAAHAVGERGLVRVTTRPSGDGVELTVADDGVGMTPETRARLFEPFFTTKPVGQGTGLGLAVVHGIVTRHGGRVEVETAPGRGSTFSVWLPRAAADPSRAA
jgi:two-component system NtrC family sensor kinase